MELDQPSASASRLITFLAENSDEIYDRLQLLLPGNKNWNESKNIFDELLAILEKII